MEGSLRHQRGVAQCQHRQAQRHAAGLARPHDQSFARSLAAQAPDRGLRQPGHVHDVAGAQLGPLVAEAAPHCKPACERGRSYYHTVFKYEYRLYSYFIRNANAEEPMTSTLFDLAGKVAVITGSSRGIGLASARRTAEHGAKVVICGRKAEACEAAAAEINANPGSQGVALPVQHRIDRRSQSRTAFSIMRRGAVDAPSR
jgi:hypothetical protein